MRIGFLGLGAMGAPIARHILARHPDLLVCARRLEPLAAFEALGARTGTDTAQLGSCDLVVLCLLDAAATREALFGPRGFAPTLTPGACVLDLATHDPASAQDVAARLAERGASYVDAPVSGMEKRAADGTLTVMCGGPDDLVDRLRPVLSLFASRIVHMGPTGSGQAAKLFNQLLFNVNIAALAELMPLAARLGLDPEKIAEIVNTGTGRSHASEFYLPAVLDGRLEAGYGLAKAYKDMQAGVRLSAEHAAPLPVLAAATATYQTALRHGHGDLGKAAMFLPFEAVSKVAFRRRAAVEAPAPLRVACTLALQGLLCEMRPDLEGRLGRPLDIVFEPTRLVERRVAVGEPLDAVLVTAEAAAALHERAKGSAPVPLALSLVGIAGRKGEAVPPLPDRAALAAFLRSLRSVCYSGSGASGIAFAALLDDMGLRETVDAKATVIASGLTGERVADGTCDYAVQQISELRLVDGLADPVPLPPDAQTPGLFSLVVMAPGEQAQAFADTLSSRGLDPALERWGLRRC